MTGGQATEQGDCSKFKTNIPHCCRKDPEVVDLLPGTPYNMQIANCCKGGVLTSWAQDPNNAVASFQVSVGQAGTTNRTVKVPKKFTLKAPGPGYTCGTAKLVAAQRLSAAVGFASPPGRCSLDSICNPLDDPCVARQRWCGCLVRSFDLIRCRCLLLIIRLLQSFIWCLES
jgi:hypothetical protein